LSALTREKPWLGSREVAGRRGHSKTFKDWGGWGGGERGRRGWKRGVDGRERRGKGGLKERGSGWPSAVQHQGLVRVLV